MSVNHFLIFILTSICIEYCSGDVFYIGAVFDRNFKLNSAILKYAIETANTKILIDSGIQLQYQIEEINYGNEFEASQTVCELLNGKANAIFAPKSSAASAHIASICDAKEIPYIDTFMDIEAKTTTINLYPSQITLSQLLIDIVDEYQWTDFTILYEAPYYIKRIAPLLEYRNNRNGIITIQPIEVETNFRPVLQKIKEMDDRSRNIIIESSIEHLTEILDQILQVGLFTPDRSFIITNLDAQTISLEKYQYTKANITLFRLIDFDAPAKSTEINSIRRMLEQIVARCKDGRIPDCTPEETEELNADYFQLTTMLIYDATMVLAEALKEIGSEHLEIGYGQSIDCFDKDSTWSKGLTINNYMKATKYSGLTGQVEFDNSGLRSEVEIDVLILTEDGLNKTGTFKPSDPKRLVFLNRTDDDSNSDDLPISQKTFKVVISVVAPYIMLKDTSTGLTGNDRYEGFGIDIVEELSQIYGFKYIFVEQTNADYGKYNNNTGEWSGMIGRVRSKGADLAITDLTINSDRIEALDFTPSFMNLGIALLYRKPVKEPPSTFSFMSPFSMGVWYFLGGAYVIVSLCFFCLGRLSASQWENRYPCVEEPTFLENQFTLNNSMWFAAGALLQQGSEIEPKAASIRLASSFWWFFTLIMVSSYTANLAMFLVIENKVPKIKSVEDLKDCGNEGGFCPVNFGAKKDGATFGFFKESTDETYQSMYRYMMAHYDDLPKDNPEGIRRVYSGEEDYAFLMESKSIDYETERKCNLTTVGKPLDDKNYGIGMRKDFKYAQQFNEGMLQLQERGVLAELQKRWWKERKGGGACSASIADEGAVPLDMANIVGVFYVLIAGTLFAIIYGGGGLMIQVYNRARKHKKDEASEAVPLDLENLKGVFFVLLYGTIFACVYGYAGAIYLVYRRAKSQKISFKEELKTEIKFLMSCQGVKQVRHRKGSKSQYSGTSSRFSAGTNSQTHGSNQLLNLE